MANVEGTTRKSFFPNSKGKSVDKSWAAKKSSLQRNTTDKTSELSSTTERDAKVNISDAIKDFSRIKRAVDLAPDVDNSAKIARLKSQIKNGTYKPNYEAIADKLIQSEF